MGRDGQPYGLYWATTEHMSLASLPWMAKKNPTKKQKSKGLSFPRPYRLANASAHTGLPTCVAYRIKRAETSWGCKKSLKCTNSWREQRAGD